MTPEELLALWKKKSALHSEQVYDRDLTLKVEASDGLYMDIQHENSNGENTLYITFRGTDFESSMDWYSNLQYGKSQYMDNRSAIANKITPIINDAAYDGANVVFTGHSLGGMLAQYAAVDLANLAEGDVALITYDAPGISDAVKAAIGTTEYNANAALIDHTQHYIVEGSLVSSLGDSNHVLGVGQNSENSINLIDYDASGIDPSWALIGHDMSNILKVINAGSDSGSFNGTLGDTGFDITSLTSTPNASIKNTVAELQGIIAGNGNDTDIFEQEAFLRIFDALLQTMDDSAHVSNAMKLMALSMPDMLQMFSNSDGLGLLKAAQLKFVFEGIDSTTQNEIHDFAQFYNSTIKSSFTSLINGLDGYSSNTTYANFMAKASAAEPSGANAKVAYWLFLNTFLPLAHEKGMAGFSESGFNKENMQDYVWTKLEPIADDYTGFSSTGIIQSVMGIGSMSSPQF